jgi:hypothetical protein
MKNPAVLIAALCVAAGAALGVAGATAQTFYYDSYGGFNAATETPAGTGTYVNDPDTATGGGTYDVGADYDPRAGARFVDVTWGVAQGSLGPYAGRSGFALSKVNDGTVVAGGGEVVFGELTHFNRPINLNSELQTVRMDWSLQLFDTLAAAQSNAGAFRTIDLSFTLYNWETPNTPASNPAYSVSYDNGATWTTYGPGLCPGSTPAGTLIAGPLGRIYRSAFTDHPGNPVWNGECADGHVYEGSATNVYTFSRGGRDYRVELIGFYGPTGELTQTFWACETQQCFGTVNFRIADITRPPDTIPTLSEWALMAMTLLLGASGWVALRRR